MSCSCVYGLVIGTDPRRHHKPTYRWLHTRKAVMGFSESLIVQFQPHSPKVLIEFKHCPDCGRQLLGV